MYKRKAVDSEIQSKRVKQHETCDENELNLKEKRKFPAKLRDITWPDDDILQLLSRVEASLPKNDFLPFDVRVESMDWEAISFKKYSIKDCQQMWVVLLKEIRKFRILKEIVVDMKTMVQSPKNANTLKHPQRPKRARNSYMLFVAEKRPEMVQENPNLTPQNVSKELAKLFKNLPPEEKEKYSNMSKRAQKEYKEKLHEFYEHNPEFAPRLTLKKEKIDIGVPEPPKRPFQIFMEIEASKENNPNQSNIMQMSKEKWEETPDGEKFFFINWAEEQNSKYEANMKVFLKKHPDYEPMKLKPLLTKREVSIKEKCLGKPTLPPRSAYNLFFKMTASKLDTKMAFKDIAHYIAEKWNSTSEEDKAEYQIRINQMWEEFCLKIDDYVAKLPARERDAARRELLKYKPKSQKRKKRRKNVTEVKENLKPVPPPSNEYHYFLTEYKGDKNPANVWKRMNDREKQLYKDEFDEKYKEYIFQYENYLKSLSKEELYKLNNSITEKFDTSTLLESSDSEG